MTIKLTVADRTVFSVRGTLSGETGAAEAFEFRLTARRLTTQALQAAVAMTDRRIEDFVADVAIDWSGVLDDAGAPVPFSLDALRKLFDNVPGLAGLAFSAYLEANGARAKN